MKIPPIQTTVQYVCKNVASISDVVKYLTASVKLKYTWAFTRKLNAVNATLLYKYGLTNKK